MSFDIFVQCFDRGSSSSIERDRVRKLFGSVLVESGPQVWQLRYDEMNSCDVSVTADLADSAMIQGFSIHRPCGDKRLWQSLAHVLSLGNLVLYFPGGAPLIADERVADHLPLAMVESLGKPVLVKYGHEIEQQIRAA